MFFLSIFQIVKKYFKRINSQDEIFWLDFTALYSKRYNDNIDKASL